MYSQESHGAQLNHLQLAIITSITRKTANALTGIQEGVYRQRHIIQCPFDYVTDRLFSSFEMEIGNLTLSSVTVMPLRIIICAF